MMVGGQRIYFLLSIAMLGIAASTSCADSTWRPRTIYFGCFVSAFLSASDGFAAEQLGLSDEEVASLEAMAFGLGKSGKYVKLKSVLRPQMVGEWDIDSYYQAAFVDHTEFVTDFNTEIMGRIDDVLGNNRRRRFREIYTQNMLRRAEFDGILRLNNIEADLAEYHNLREQHRVLSESRPTPSLPILEYRTGLNVMSVYLDKDELEAASGKEFSGSLRETKSEGMSRFDSSPMILLQLPEVQMELKLTLGQLRDLPPTLTSLLSVYNAKTEQNVNALAASPKDVIDEMTKWNTEVRKSISKVLNDDQFARLDQLVFQRHVRGLCPAKAMQAAGTSYNPAIRRGTDWNLVQAEAFYQYQAHQLQFGLDVLSSVTGEGKARDICGKIVLPPSGWRGVDPEADEEIRQRVTASLLEPTQNLSPKKNPRRRLR